jgi:hypothetical protein
MELESQSREYVLWPIAEQPVGSTLEVSFDEGATWNPLTVDGAEARALVAGPDATGNPAGTVVLPLGSHRAWIRATANPELVYRYAGVVDVI